LYVGGKKVSGGGKVQLQLKALPLPDPSPPLCVLSFSVYLGWDFQAQGGEEGDEGNVWLGRGNPPGASASSHSTLSVFSSLGLD
jgi:hypothetical protein